MKVQLLSLRSPICFWQVVEADENSRMRFVDSSEGFGGRLVEGQSNAAAVRCRSCCSCNGYLPLRTLLRHSSTTGTKGRQGRPG